MWQLLTLLTLKSVQKKCLVKKINMKSAILFVFVVLACGTCIVSAAPTVITAPFTNIVIPEIPIGLSHVGIAAPFTTVNVAHPKSHVAYPGLDYGYSSSYYPSYYPTYYSSVHPFSTVRIG